MPEDKLFLLKSQFKCEDWQNLRDSNNAHEQAQIFHQNLVDQCNKILPEKNKDNFLRWPAMVHRKVETVEQEKEDWVP